MKLNTDAIEVKQADGVLAALEARPLSGLFIVTPYENGREHGYVVTDEQTGRAVTFAEFRRSDSIVVYWGDFQAALNHDHGDKMYEAASFFDYQDYRSSSLAILEYFKQGRKARKAGAP